MVAKKEPVDPSKCQLMASKNCGFYGGFLGAKIGDGPQGSETLQDGGLRTSFHYNGAGPVLAQDVGATSVPELQPTSQPEPDPMGL